MNLEVDYKTYSDHAKNSGLSNARGDWIYIVAVPDAKSIKIGRSIVPADRWAGLMSAWPKLFKIEPLLVLDGCGKQYEKELHRKYLGLRSHGEWFMDEGTIRFDCMDYLISGYQSIPEWIEFCRSGRIGIGDTTRIRKLIACGRITEAEKVLKKSISTSA